MDMRTRPRRGDAEVQDDRQGDPFFPCSVLGDRYQEDCWAMQPAVMLQLYDGDFDKTFRGCDRAPEAPAHDVLRGHRHRGERLLAARDHNVAIGLCSEGAIRSTSRGASAAW